MEGLCKVIMELSLVWNPLSYDPFKIYARKQGPAKEGSHSKNTPAYNRSITNHPSLFDQYLNENLNLNSESFQPSIWIPYKAKIIEYFDL